MSPVEVGQSAVLMRSAPHASVAAGGHVARILVVEDEEEIRFMLAEVPADARHDVIEAESGDAASVLLDGVGALDALVTDVHMPGRLNGLSLGRQFRARYPDTPILYVTGSPDALATVPMRKDTEIVLAKPYRLRGLVDRIEAMLVCHSTAAS
jgi:two-component system, cell cycle sensor histidine kinase and response regulator CckA